MTPNVEDPRLTMREQQALKALMDQRLVYKAGGHSIAAHAIGVAIWLLWQTFTRVEHS